MASGKYILQELTDEGGRNPRLEIDEFLLDNDMTNLFLLALSSIQKDSLKPVNGGMNLLNFYALASIHGAPREKWSGVPNTVEYGYCHHSRDTFPTWHRPYMKLYETAVYLEMVKQAKLFKKPADQQKYSQAAQRYRLPYWDPLMPRNDINATDEARKIWGLPKVFRQKTVHLRTPVSPDVLVEFDNPLYEFRFPSSTDFDKNKNRERLVMDPTFDTVHTVKCPDAKGVTSLTTLDERIQAQGNLMASAMWQLLAPSDLGAGKRSWNLFATKLANPNKLPGGSIESWHDKFHVVLGQGVTAGSGHDGHMGDPEYAGFEPMFWMHHNNIDRLLAIHQALYGRNVEDQQSLNAPLYPFLKDEKTCYTSDDGIVKNYWSPGFGVPGSQPTKGIQRLVQKYMTDTYYWAVAGSNNKLKPLANWPKDLSGSEALYGSKAKPSTASTIMEMTSFALDADEKPILVFRSAPVDQLNNNEVAADDRILDSSTILQSVDETNNVILGHDVTLKPAVREAILSQVWDAHIRVRKYAFNGTFGVHIFIGYVKDNQTERFLTKKNEVGFFGVFATPTDHLQEPTRCAGCKQNRLEDITVEDTIPLTNYLFDYLESNPKSEGLIDRGIIKKINSLEPAEVVPFLKEHLQWRMVDLQNNLLVDREQEAQLEVTVTNRTFTPPNADNLMGFYGPMEVYDEITREKPGGHGYVYPQAEL